MTTEILCSTLQRRIEGRVRLSALCFIIPLAIVGAMFSSCHTINTILKNPDPLYKMEVARQMYAEGKYSNTQMLLDNILPMFKNTKTGDEALFLMGMCKYNQKDYEEASEIFKRYYTRSYPSGDYVDQARFYAAMSYYKSTMPVILDQTNTLAAIDELQNILEYNPESKYAGQVKGLIFELQDKLVEKEYLAAKLYYNLGGYFNNCNFGGNNYQACVTTAQNAVRDYPFSPRKEEFAIMILRAKFHLAEQSIERKKFERFNDTVDEYYGFVNEFPNSKYIDEAKTIFSKSDAELKSKRLQKYQQED